MNKDISTFFSMVFVFLVSSTFTPLVSAERLTYDELVVNDHQGYLTAWEKSGELDKVFLLVAGFDTKNDEHPADVLYTQYKELIDLLAPQGWDIILFDYVNGTIDLKHNADNLARFIDYLDTQVGKDYHLAVVGGSMGGIVARTMFVQEYRDMGVDTYVSVDSPHWGVSLSEWVEDLATVLLDYKAGHQMHNGDPQYYEHYGWLRAVENDGAFMASVIDPMNTCAIALSNGEDGYWKVTWDDLAIHNKFYPVSSFFSAKGLKSTYMPYHSTVYMTDRSTKRKLRFGYTRYRYKDTRSRYFDTKIANDAAEHGAPEYAIKQAVEFVLKHQP